MKVSIRNGGIPTDDDVVADAHFQFAKQHRIGEITVISDDHASVSTEIEMHAIHGTMRANDQGVHGFAVEAFEGEIIGNDRVWAKTDVVGRDALRPAARR